MKKFHLILSLLLFSVLFSLGFTVNQDPINKDKPVSKPELILKFYKDLHYPYDAVLPQDVNERILNDLKNFPAENDRAVNSWYVKGPLGMKIYNTMNSYYSGRVLEIEVDNGVSTRLAAASGGLWGFVLIFPVALSDNLNTLVVSAFDTKPGDGNTIFVGTGEYGIRIGTGLWRTTNGGTNWTNVPLSPTPYFFFKVKYDPVNSNIIHIATSAGYYKSTNGGTSFTRYLSGFTTDIAVNPSDNQIMYTSV